MRTLKLPLTSSFVDERGYLLHNLPETDSTNSYLRLLHQNTNPSPATVVAVTANQTSGKGRQGRGWETPDGEALAVSVLRQIPFIAQASSTTGSLSTTQLTPGWVPLLTGSAVVQALQPFLPASKRAVLKWPNDVHVVDAETRNEAADSTATMQPAFGLKICGILCEMLPDLSVIIGVGTNLFTSEEHLATERACSLASLYASVGSSLVLADATAAYSAYEEPGAEIADRFIVALLKSLEQVFALATENPDLARERVREDTHTIGQSVRVELPDGNTLVGVAEALADDGSLVVKTEAETVSVSAGDVWHLRPAH